jgi:heme-degrading monooxygenase HmoA
MILEIADIRIPPGRQSEFEAAIVRAAQTILTRAKGFRSYEIRHGVESPERYILMITWETIEDHNIGFRQSELFTEWRAIISPFFAQPPQVEHFSLLSQS